LTTQKRELEFGVAVGTAGDAKRAVNVTKNLVRLQPSRSPFVCKQAYPRLQNAAVTGHFGPKPAWDFKQSVFNQRAAFEEGRSHLDKGRGKGTRNAFHAAVMADVDDAKANILLARLCKNSQELMLATLSVLVENYPLLLSVFKAYAAHTDFAFAMNLTSFTEFVTDCEMVDNDHCFLAHFDNIFVAVNAVSDNTINPEYQDIAIRNNKHTLSRSEFLASILRIADLRYGADAPKPMPLDQALRELLRDNISKAQRLPGDQFRQNILYTKEVDEVLREHRERLRKRYDELSRKAVPDFITVPKKLKHRNLSLNEFKQFLMEANLVPEVVHERAAIECFTGALLLVEREYLKPHHMGSYHDFLEMVVRLAMVLHDSMDESKPQADERTDQISVEVDDLDDFAFLLDAFVLEVLDGRKSEALGSVDSDAESDVSRRSGGSSSSSSSSSSAGFGSPGAIGSSSPGRARPRDSNPAKLHGR
jgi:hypothetical protein